MKRNVAVTVYGSITKMPMAKDGVLMSNVKHPAAAFVVII